MPFSSLLRYFESASRRGPRGHILRKARAHRVPQLEILEDRTVPSTLTVTSAADDSSAGTLRVVLAAAHNGDTIRFVPQLNGQTIVLTQGQLVINQSLAIAGPGAARLAISGNDLPYRIREKTKKTGRRESISPSSRGSAQLAQTITK